MPSETIFALSSGRLPSAVAVLRVSGPGSRFALETITRRSAPAHRQAVLRRLHGANGEVIDAALVLFWEGPESFTGEDVAEFQVHGSRAVVARLMTELGGLAGMRPALPGEFTRRAFLNGRMDLTAVEGLGDLIAAETEAQRQSAVGQMSGRFRDHCEAWRRALVQAMAWIEAGIDFTDEADVPADVQRAAWDDIRRLRTAIADVIDGSRAAERIRDGLNIVLLGRPNAGKSSLLNWLAGRDVAIVSEEAGTTRDLIEVDLDLGGFPVRVIDTAGLREDGGGIEKEGMRRARDRAARADLVLLLQAPDDPDEAPTVSGSATVWPIRSKIDLDESQPKQPRPSRLPRSSERPMGLSVKTGTGLAELLARLQEHAAEHLGVSESGFVLHLRQKDLLMTCVNHLDNALARLDVAELAGEELRLAGQALGRITGAISPDDVLGEIFQRFCIGK